ncbi:MAG: hypothetical protein P1Q69_14750, partial [Candidatus Thorarchaeota archaeon]|nr:hypothetical protein [Candidatus Thorarchaeota archaeon]
MSTLTLGEHDLTITVYDVDDRSISDTVHVRVVDDAPPSIDGPDDMNVQFGTTGNNITWNPTDPTPISYEIFKDDKSIKTGPWNSTLETITIDIDGLAIEEYNYTLFVTDESALTASDTVIVTVDDFTVPTVNSPADITYTVGSTGHSFTWYPEDDFPVGYTLWLDGIISKSGAWNLTTGESITVDADGYPVEYYNFTAVFTDLGGNAV